MRDHYWSLTLTLPPLGALFMRPERETPPNAEG
jgi:hypothetical protein